MDYSNYIILKTEKNYLWLRGDFYKAIKLLGTLYDVHHEEEENWASIEVKGELVGYMWRNNPLVFVSNTYHDSFVKLLKQIDFITYYSVDSLKFKLFKIDESLKEDLDFQKNNEILSPEDIWFYTI